MKKYLIFSI